MTAYLDNNILIDYERGKLTLPLPNVKYAYSYVHLEELLESKEHFNDLKDVRIKTLQTLTDCRYISNNEMNSPSFYIANPEDILRCFENPVAQYCSQEIHKATSHWKGDENPEELMRILGIEKKVINNYIPSQLLENYGNIIIHYIQQTGSLGLEVFQSFFNILDLLGFWQDRVDGGSTLNRSYDASHAYFATACDYFVTNDKKTKNKANAIYKICGYRTKAVSYSEFISMEDDKKS